jgi:hypothetical protein
MVTPQGGKREPVGRLTGNRASRGVDAGRMSLSVRVFSPELTQHNWPTQACPLSPISAQIHRLQPLQLVAQPRGFLELQIACVAVHPLLQLGDPRGQLRRG